MYAHPEKSGVRRGPEAAGNLMEEPRRLWGSGGLTNAKQEERTNRWGAKAGEGSGEQRGQDTGAMEDKEDEGASSSHNLHQTVDFARALAPAPVVVGWTSRQPGLDLGRADWRDRIPSR